LDSTLTVHDGAVLFLAGADGSLNWPRRVLHGWYWTTPELVPAWCRLMLRNRRVLEGRAFTGALRRPGGAVARGSGNNSLAEVADTSIALRPRNEFFASFSIPILSCILSCVLPNQPPIALEQAKPEGTRSGICRRLRPCPTDHVLEIGSGWGGFAVWDGDPLWLPRDDHDDQRRTVSHVCEWRSRIGEAGARIEVLRADYRELTGTVRQGRQHRDVRGGRPQALRRLFLGGRPPARSGRRDVLQTITVDDQWFPKYHGTADWIEKVHLPGRRTGRRRRDAEVARAHHIALDVSGRELWNAFTRTPCAPGARGPSEPPRVRALGFDDRFIRMWDLYLASCEATFLERTYRAVPAASGEEPASSASSSTSRGLNPTRGRTPQAPANRRPSSDVESHERANATDRTPRHGVGTHTK